MTSLPNKAFSCAESVMNNSLAKWPVGTKDLLFECRLGHRLTSSASGFPNMKQLWAVWESSVQRRTWFGQF